MLVHDYLKFHAREQPQQACCILDECTLTYAEVYENSIRLANALLNRGLKQGDRFAFLARNSIETVITYMAGSAAGLVPVALNWRLAPPEWKYIVNDSGAKLLIAEAEFCNGIESVRDRLENVHSLVSIGAPDRNGWLKFTDLCRDSTACEPTRTATASDVFYQMYTSGTTGRAKGALLTHRSVLSNSMQTMPYFSHVLGPGRKTLIVMPLFHAGASSFMVGSIVSGSTMVIHKDFSAAAVVDALAAHGINVVNLVPAMLQAMLVDVPDLRDRCYDELDVIIYGASSISESTLRVAMEVFGCDFYQGFGQTESSAVITFLTAADHRYALAEKPELLLSAGREIAGTTVRIVDSEDRELPAGETGEIVMRGPQMMKGYWNQSEATVEAMRNGWLHTGDIGVLDEDGYLFVRGRVKDMIISGGENVYPREIENVLFEHPLISDVAVVGRADEKYGEAVVAVTVLTAGASLKTADVVEFCRGKIGGYKIPRSIKIVDELPRNPSGKILKNELRKLVSICD